MEKISKGLFYEQRDLMIQQLIEGYEATKQLKKRISMTSSQHDYDGDNHGLKDVNDDYEALNHSLLETIFSAFSKSISIAKLINGDKNSHRHLQSPTKKRKMMPRWSKKVSIGSATTVSGLEGAPDDGFSWRKYGQKDILGSKYPRGYYRCTHRITQECFATKQVQRSDEDPLVYQIIYKGSHTCTRGVHLSKVKSKPNMTQIKNELNVQSLQNEQPHDLVLKSFEQEVYVGLGPNGSKNVETTENKSPTDMFSPCSLTPRPLECGSSDNFLLDCTHSFGSQDTSNSNHFLVTHFLSGQDSDSNFKGSISGSNSVSNSPTHCNFEFPIDIWENIKFDANLSSFF